MSGYRIGALARTTGVRVETIRFYEAQGLLPPPARSAKNYRLYDRAHLDRLSFIKRSRDLGFTLDQVRALLRLADDPAAPCGEVDEIASGHLTQVDRKIADLQALRAELAKRLACDAGSTVAECRIIEALGPER